MKKNYLSQRFHSFDKGTLLTIIAMTVIDLFALYMSIAFSVKLASGLTLFGDSSTYTNDAVEVKGPTSSDITVLILFWVLTVLVLALDIYLIFFKKQNNEKIVRKEIYNGKTILVEEKNDQN